MFANVILDPFTDTVVGVTGFAATLETGAESGIVGLLATTVRDACV
jgi:hypothetical protein